MAESVEVAIIGGGQAGLAVSFFLSQAGVDHVVLEKGRLAETWRSRRWDSFCLVTPNWSVTLPGATYGGPDPDGYMSLAQLIAHFGTWATSFKAPVMENTTVSSLDSDGGRFALSIEGIGLVARQVVVATGAYQKPYRPAAADQISKSAKQIYAEDYRNSTQLPPGAVLIIGSGQTGCQLAEELHESGRKVFLSCGRCAWVPRRVDGKDIVWWLAQTGFLDRTLDQLPSAQAKLLGNIQATGHGGGHDLHFRTLHQMGVELVGRFTGAEGSTVAFADDVGESVDFGDARWAEIKQWIVRMCDARGLTVPDMPAPPPFRIKTRTQLDLDRDGVGAIIWTSGYRPDYSWVKFPVFDGLGFPVTADGASSVPGLFFNGVHWMRKNKSSILYGVGEDAEIVARQVIGMRR